LPDFSKFRHINPKKDNQMTKDSTKKGVQSKDGVNIKPQRGVQSKDGVNIKPERGVQSKDGVNIKPER
jgi:hypothetical protein